jgi:hypothetical protein
VLVVRVVSPVTSRESWTVVGDDDRPVAPVEQYLAYLTGIERSPNTVKAYAHDLKDSVVALINAGLPLAGTSRRDPNPGAGVVGPLIARGAFAEDTHAAAGER